MEEEPGGSSTDRKTQKPDRKSPKHADQNQSFSVVFGTEETKPDPSGSGQVCRFRAESKHEEKSFLMCSAVRSCSSRSPSVSSDSPFAGTGSPPLPLLPRPSSSHQGYSQLLTRKRENPGEFSVRGSGVRLRPHCRAPLSHSECVTVCV